MAEAARPAGPADLDRVVALAERARAELGDQERGGPLFVAREAGAPPTVEALKALLDDDDAIVLVGSIDDVIIGFATGRTEAVADGSQLGVIADLYVEPEAREVGVGEAMMELLVPWFQGRGCRGVDAMALPGVRATKNFFEMSGFTARLIVMHHRLDAT